MFNIVSFILMPRTKEALIIYTVPRLYKDGDLEKLRAEMGEGYDLLKQFLKDNVEKEK